MAVLITDKKSIKIRTFWKLFQNNEEKLFLFEGRQAPLLTELLVELNNFKTPVVVELSPVMANGKRQFIVSADGIKKGFPFVEKIVAMAPPLQKWDVIAFRQPKTNLTQIQIGKLRLRISDVYFTYQTENTKLAVDLYIKDYADTAEYNIASFLILDALIGEYDTETMLGSISRHPLKPSHILHLKPIASLPEVLAFHKKELFGN